MYKLYKASILIDEVNFLEDGKRQLSPKLENYYAIEVDIRNQRPRLRRTRLILVGKALGDCKVVSFNCSSNLN